MADITMPQLGETVTEGTIIRWLKKVGDTVAQDEALFEVSTDKVDSEVPSPASGVLSEIFVQEGETVDVGARLATVGAASDAPSAPPAPVELPPTEAPPAPAFAPPTAPPPPPPPPDPVSAPASATNAPQVPVTAAPPAPDEPEAANSNGSRGALLSPVVRRLISEHGLEPAAIPGTGAGGRITREDVTSYIDARATGASTTTPPPTPVAPTPVAPTPEASSTEASSTAAPAAAPVAARTPVPSQAVATTNFVPAPSAPVAAPAALSTPAPPLGSRDEIIPFSGFRRVTAEHMVRSKATSAHTLVAVEADFENVDRVRKAHREAFKADEGVSLTYLPFVARATLDVLRQYPHLNSSVGDDALIVHRDVHLGIAVDIAKEGLIVPVLHNADGQSLRGLARSIADLAVRARSRKLSADDIAGGTFTITNPGPYGTFLTVPIIAQPQVAILSTDGVKRKPVVVVGPGGDESIAIHSVGMLALSFDHRAVDGAYAAAFMSDLATVIATRDWAAEL